MPPKMTFDTEAQFKFLLTCVKHSANGKVDFDKVATELDIVSKAAASKRYERMLKTHDITRPVTGGKSPPNKPPTPAKRKRNNKAADEAKGDDDDSHSNEDAFQEAPSKMRKYSSQVKSEEKGE